MTFYLLGNEKKTINNLNTLASPLTIKLRPVTYDIDNLFINIGKPLDTVYYKNKKIQRINFRGHDEITFYENGQLKSKTVDGSYRVWYKNGQLKYQSILKNNHHRTDTKWYDNGQKKSQGTSQWGYNKKINEGDWLDNNDWIYWDKKGNVIKKQK